MYIDPTTSKRCVICKEIKSLKDFRDTSSWQGRKYSSSYCDECRLAKRRAWYKASDTNKKRVRASELRTKFGITIDEYEELAAYQDHVCAICEKPCASGISLAVDHCHKTGRVRGLLCKRCNQMLGVMFDSPELLRRAADYLEGK